MSDEILLDSKTGKPVIFKQEVEPDDRHTQLANYPKTDLFKPKTFTHAPHPYCITPYHINNNPHHMYLGKEQIEQMETDVQHSLCGFGRTASGKYEKKGQTACNLLHDEHKLVLVIEVASSYIESHGEDTTKPELQDYVKSIADTIEADGYAGIVFMEEECDTCV